MVTCIQFDSDVLRINIKRKIAMKQYGIKIRGIVFPRTFNTVDRAFKYGQRGVKNNNLTEVEIKLFSNNKFELFEVVEL
jgi:hypothetical protein